MASVKAEIEVPDVHCPNEGSLHIHCEKIEQELSESYHGIGCDTISSILEKCVVCSCDFFRDFFCDFF